jgi:hypothetical protein
MNDCRIAVDVENHTNFGFAASLATLNRFPIPPVSPPIGDTSPTDVMRLVAHSTTSPTPTAMGQSFIITRYIKAIQKSKNHRRRIFLDNYYRQHCLV